MGCLSKWLEKSEVKPLVKDCGKNGPVLFGGKFVNLFPSTIPLPALSIHPHRFLVCLLVSERLERQKLHFPDSLAARVLEGNWVHSPVTWRVERGRRPGAADCCKHQWTGELEGSTEVSHCSVQSLASSAYRGRSQVHIPMSCHCFYGCQNTTQWFWPLGRNYLPGCALELKSSIGGRPA